MGRLKPTMGLEAFDRGYWYATQVKAFGQELGIPGAAKLRKDELEKAIRVFLKTGVIAAPTTRELSRQGMRDVERGLKRSLRVRLYTNDRETKDFLEREARRVAPGFKRKSGARYRLNRFREGQLMKGVALTYGALVDEYVRLCAVEKFEQVPVGRYINFLADFLKGEKNATHAAARKAWHRLKKLNVPKSYRAWKESTSRG